MRSKPVRSSNLRPVSLLLLTCALALPASAQQRGEPASIEVTPETLTLRIGETASLSATVKDAAGNVLDVPVVFFSMAFQNVGVTPEGEVEAYRPGTFTISAVVPNDPDAIVPTGLTGEILVTILPAAIASISLEPLPSPLYAGTTLELASVVVDESGARRHDVEVSYASSDRRIARVDDVGRLHLEGPGRATIRARAAGASAAVTVEVVADPVARFALRAPVETARTGDVLHFEVVAEDAAGRPVQGLPVRYAVSGRPHPDVLAPGATAQVEPDGRFVAERSGVYTIVAYAGNHVARADVEIAPRAVQRQIELVGHGPVRDRHTSDLWVWEGVDGRDYAVTGTWGAAGHAYFWDVTEPPNIVKVSEMQVDARTVNDVKVSEDGRVAVISREGASSRRNGIVIIDVADPRNPEILSDFDDQLTGGVHNVFVYQNHVYALSAGERYDVINIEDPRNPYRVSSFELETRGHSIHDVWVADGIAYSSNWADGVVAVDVGGGGKGGSPANPVYLGSATYPSGANHAAFPFRSRSTGKFYVIAGDEIFPFAFDTEGGGKPTYTRGWLHFFEWSSFDDEPVEVARYQVPEAGTHNLWVDEDDELLYVAYYNGGLRIVDISGELLGDLYRQGREVGSFLPDDPEGYIANAPFVWGPQPHKGNVFFSDWNSGLWCVRLTDRPARPIAEPHD